MSKCNYCLWQRMKETGRYRIATDEEREKLWNVDPKYKGTIVDGGVCIVHVRGSFVCWFAELPDHCCC